MLHLFLGSAEELLVEVGAQVPIVRVVAHQLEDVLLHTTNDNNNNNNQTNGHQHQQPQITYKKQLLSEITTRQTRKNNNITTIRNVY